MLALDQRDEGVMRHFDLILIVNRFARRGDRYAIQLATNRDLQLGVLREYAIKKGGGWHDHDG